MSDFGSQDYRCHIPDNYTVDIPDFGPLARDNFQKVQSTFFRLVDSSKKSVDRPKKWIGGQENTFARCVPNILVKFGMDLGFWTTSLLEDKRSRCSDYPVLIGSTENLAITTCTDDDIRNHIEPGGGTLT